MVRRHNPRVSVEAARHGFWPNEVQPSLPIEDDVHWDDKPKVAWPLRLDPDLPTDALGQGFPTFLLLCTTYGVIP